MQIDSGIEQLGIALEEQGFDSAPIHQAQDEWRSLATLSGTILSGESLRGNARVGEQVEAFEALIDRLAHQLETVHDAVRTRNEMTHQQALASLALSEYWRWPG